MYSFDKIDYQPSLHCDFYMQMHVEYIGGKTKAGDNKHEAKVTFAYSKDGKKFTPCGDAFTMRQGKWIGAKFGLVAVESNPKSDRGWIEADWMRVRKE